MSQVAFRITNSAEKDITLDLEPWSQQYTMSSGVSYRVEAGGPESDVLEREYNEHKLVVYGWTGSVTGSKI